jgi:hypothetical protein
VLVAVLELDPGWSPEGLRLLLDGEDVTGSCEIRTDRAWPPRRAEVVLAGLTPGAHRAELTGPGADPHEWSFRVLP